MCGKIDDMSIIWQHFLRVWVCRGLWMVVWHCLALFILQIKSQNILKNAEKSYDLGHIGGIKPNKAKLEIFVKYFFRHFLWEIWKAAKNLKKCREVVWWKTSKNYDIKLSQTVKQILFVFGDHLKSHIIELGFCWWSVYSLVTFRKLGPLLMVVNGHQQQVTLCSWMVSSWWGQ